MTTHCSLLKQGKIPANNGCCHLTTQSWRKEVRMKKLHLCLYPSDLSLKRKSKSSSYVSPPFLPYYSITKWVAFNYHSLMSNNQSYGRWYSYFFPPARFSSTSKSSALFFQPVSQNLALYCLSPRSKQQQNSHSNIPSTRCWVKFTAAVWVPERHLREAP